MLKAGMKTALASKVGTCHLNVFKEVLVISAPIQSTQHAFIEKHPEPHQSSMNTAQEPVLAHRGAVSDVEPTTTLQTTPHTHACQLQYLTMVSRGEEMQRTLPDDRTFSVRIKPQ